MPSLWALSLGLCCALALAVAVAVAVTDDDRAGSNVKISHDSVLLPFVSPMDGEGSRSATNRPGLTISVSQGEYLWESTNEKVVQVEHPKAGQSVVIKSASTRNDTASASIIAIPLDKVEREGVEEDCTGDLKLDVYVAPIARIEILTTVRKIGVNETEVIELQAFDKDGNVFSSLDSVPCKWSVSPDSGGPVQISQLRETAIAYTKGSHLYELERGGDFGSKIQIRGVHTGIARLTARLRAGNYEPYRTLEASIVINVVENLKLCPMGVFAPIMVPVNSSVLFSAYVDLVGFEVIECRRPMFEIKVGGKYEWILSGNADVASVDPQGRFVAKSIGETEIVFREKNYHFNQVSTFIRVVKPVRMFLHYAQVPDSGEKETDGSLAPCPWRPIGKFPHQLRLPPSALWTGESASWIWILGFEYYVLASLVLKDPFDKRHVVFSADQTFAFSFGDKPPSLERDNVRKYKAEELGKTQIVVRAGEIEAIQKVVWITSPVSIGRPSPIRLPFTHELSLQVEGGTGSYQIVPQSCARYLAHLDRIESFDTFAKCELEVFDSANPVNRDHVSVIVSPPSSLQFEDGAESTYSVKIGQTLVLQVHALDVDGEPYDNCSALEMELEYDETIIQVTKSRNLAVAIAGLKMGFSDLSILRPQLSTVRIDVHDPFRIVLPSTSNVIVNTLNCDVLVSFEGGTGLSHVREKWKLEGDEVRVQKTSKPRSYFLKCLDLGEFQLLVQFGREELNLTLYCSRAVRSVVSIKSSQNVHVLQDDREDVVSIAVPVHFELNLDIFDEQDRRFDNIDCFANAWTLDDEPIDQSGMVHATNASAGVSLIRSELENGVTSTLQVQFVEAPLLLPLHHPAILNLPGAFGEFSVMGGSGDFRFYADVSPEKVSIEIMDMRKIRIETVDRAFLGVVQIFCRDHQMDEDMVGSVAKAKLVVSKPEKLVLQGSAIAFIDEPLNLTVFVLDNRGNAFSHLMHEKFLETTLDFSEAGSVQDTGRVMEGENSRVHVLLPMKAGTVSVRAMLAPNLFSNSLKLSIYEKLRITPRNVLLLRGSELQLVKHGGPPPREDITCGFFAPNEEVIAVVKDTGKVFASSVSLGEVDVTYKCTNIHDSSDVIAQAFSHIKVVELDRLEIRRGGDTERQEPMLLGGRARLHVFGISGETPVLFALPFQKFTWNVSSPVLGLEQAEGGGIWVHADQVGSCIVQATLTFQSKIVATARLKMEVVDVFKLVSPSLVIMPLHSQVQIQTNVERGVLYTLCDCNSDQTGIAISQDGILTSDVVSPRSVVVKVAHGRQTLTVLVEIVQVASIDFDHSRLLAGQTVQPRFELFDSLGRKVSPLHRYPEIQVWSHHEEIISVKGQSTLLLVSRGEATLMIWIPDDSSSPDHLSPTQFSKEFKPKAYSFIRAKVHNATELTLESKRTRDHDLQYPLVISPFSSIIVIDWYIVFSVISATLVFALLWTCGYSSNRKPIASFGTPQRTNSRIPTLSNPNRL